MSRSSLDTYRQKRDFRRTAEPRGGRARQAAGFSFVVQKHAARRLHYDFRLELDGVLKSWAVPKGPSYNPKNRRLAMQTEDHPLEYAAFEGAIPPGEYGGGVVMIWDRGFWKPESDDARGDLERGRLKFELCGTKLKGKWNLVRISSSEDKPSWLLIKARDEFAQPAQVPEVVDVAPNSVKTRRDLKQIAEKPGRVWRSNRLQAKAEKRTAPKPSKLRPKRAAARAPKRAE